ncbi:hypothetical protein EBB07_29390 [Paenibacillaceae bacterium]|nr:hypothetical protein EBB07_29390 [Paenibacillaceae bacterium]
MFDIGNKVQITWGMYEGLEATITFVNGKNITALLSIGFEYQLSTDHVIPINSNENLSSNGKKVQVGSYVEAKGVLWKVVRIEGKKAICLKMNPCNGETRKGAKEIAWTIGNLFCR